MCETQHSDNSEIECPVGAFATQGGAGLEFPPTLGHFVGSDAGNYSSENRS